MMFTVEKYSVRILSAARYIRSEWASKLTAFMTDGDNLDDDDDKYAIGQNIEQKKNYWVTTTTWAVWTLN